MLLNLWPSGEEGEGFTIWTPYQGSAPTEPTGSHKRPPDPLPKQVVSILLYYSDYIPDFCFFSSNKLNRIGGVTDREFEPSVV
jgi:hypothetical protein